MTASYFAERLGFCAGADMQRLQDLSDGNVGEERRRERRPQSYPLSVPKPIIAAINGACAGIGLVQALMCDIRFGADAREIAVNCSPASMAIMKRQVYADSERTLEQALAAADELMLASFTAPDFAEGVQSFVEKRAPDFPPLAVRAPPA